jgi:hypothetical protein
MFHRAECCSAILHPRISGKYLNQSFYNLAQQKLAGKCTALAQLGYLFFLGGEGVLNTDIRVPDCHLSNQTLQHMHRSPPSKHQPLCVSRDLAPTRCHHEIPRETRSMHLQAKALLMNYTSTLKDHTPASMLEKSQPRGRFLFALTILEILCRVTQQNHTSLGAIGCLVENVDFQICKLRNGLLKHLAQVFHC